MNQPIEDPMIGEEGKKMDNETKAPDAVLLGRQQYLRNAQAAQPGSAATGQEIDRCRAIAAISDHLFHPSESNHKDAVEALHALALMAKGQPQAQDGITEMQEAGRVILDLCTALEAVADVEGQAHEAVKLAWNNGCRWMAGAHPQAQERPIKLRVDILRDENGTHCQICTPENDVVMEGSNIGQEFPKEIARRIHYFEAPESAPKQGGEA